MTDLAHAIEKYENLNAVLSNGVEIVKVADPHGLRFDNEVRCFIDRYREDGDPLLDDFMGAARALRWRRLTEPQPLDCNIEYGQIIQKMQVMAEIIEEKYATSQAAYRVSATAYATNSEPTPLSSALLTFINEVDSSLCAIVAINRRVADGVQKWLNDEVPVYTPSEVLRRPVDKEQAYIVGPPRFFPHSIVSSPSFQQISYVYPSWFKSDSLVYSPFAIHGENSFKPRLRLFQYGESEPPECESPSASKKDESAYLPQPSWEEIRVIDKKADRFSQDDVFDSIEARRILLSGGIGIWLEAGDRIRTFDPTQDSEERVVYIDPRMVQRGTYLVLRNGQTDSEFLFDAAAALLGDVYTEVKTTQREWKNKLASRIRIRGLRSVKEELHALDIRAADQATNWLDPLVSRPRRDSDFEKLLSWLGVPLSPTISNANKLRSARQKANAELSSTLHNAASEVDIEQLERSGHVMLSLDKQGSRSNLVTRVVAINPETTKVARNRLRVPFQDRSGQWLE